MFLCIYLEGDAKSSWIQQLFIQYLLIIISIPLFFPSNSSISITVVIYSRFSSSYFLGDPFSPSKTHTLHFLVLHFKETGSEKREEADKRV